MMESLCTNITTDDNSVIDSCLTLVNIKDTIKRLKCEKKDDVYNNMASEHFINAPDSFDEYLFMCVIWQMFTSWLYALVLSTFILIPKDNKDIQTSDKYRGIALSAICTKLFEYIILPIYGHMLTSGDLQFAYRADTSPTQCMWAAREVITYYNNNSSDVYSCLLDCSKAFGHSRHDKLQQKLIPTGLSAVITRSLMKMYVNSQIQVR